MYKIEYNNDTGPDDEGFWQWWTVSNGEKTFKCDSSDDAEWLCNILNKNQWQPIESAPKDYTDIIVYRPNANGEPIPKVGVDYWSKLLGNVWAKSNSTTQPTRWQPLPEPPKDN